MDFYTEYLKNGSAVLVDGAHTISCDSLHLADFAYKAADEALDLGCGMGIILLYMADKGALGRMTGIDSDPAACELFRRSIDQNGFENISCLCGDARDYTESRKFSLVVSNPPYFTSGRTGARAAARHDGTLTLDDVCRAAARNLKQGGRLCVCIPSNRLAELFASMKSHRIEPSRLRLVRSRASVYLALCEGRYGGGAGLSVLPELVVGSAEEKSIVGGQE